MKRLLTLLMMCCLLAGAVAWWRLGVRKEGAELGKDSAVEAGAGHVAAPMPAGGLPVAGGMEGGPAQSVAASPLPPPATASMPSPVNDDPPPPPAGPGEVRTGPKFKRAYLLSLDKGALTLVNAQDVEGDFAPRRGKDEVWSNMLRFRLMSDSNQVLAEDLLPAPDQVCRVLDPRSPEAKGVTLAGTEPVVFQVRLPRVKGASRLDVFRILNPGEPATENLVASLALPRS